MGILLKICPEVGLSGGVSIILQTEGGGVEKVLEREYSELRDKMMLGFTVLRVA